MQPSEMAEKIRQGQVKSIEDLCILEGPITVRDLKTILSIFPDYGKDGNENEVWLASGDGVSSMAFEFSSLNLRIDEDGRHYADVFMSPHEDVFRTKDDIPVKLTEAQIHRKPEWMSDELAKALINTNVKPRGDKKAKGFQQGGIVPKD